MNAFIAIYQIFYWLDDYYNGKLAEQRNSIRYTADVDQITRNIQRLVNPEYGQRRFW